MRAIEANNRNDGAGRLGEGDEVLLVRSEGSIKTPGRPARDRGRTQRRHPGARWATSRRCGSGSTTRYGVVTQDGRGEAVQGLVLGLAGANAQQGGGRACRRSSRSSSRRCPRASTLKVFYNRAALVNKAVGTVLEALLEATVLVLVLLGAFLGNLRAALTVALVLPLAALTTFILMRIDGMSANLMSLGGLAIALGMLVDAAVVVVENIVQHLGHDKAAGKLPRLHIVFRAVREVAVPVTAGILIIIVVFLPLLTLQGLEGKFFVPVALTIVFALASSLLLSLTVIPVLASFLLQEGRRTKTRGCRASCCAATSRCWPGRCGISARWSSRAGVMLAVAVGVYTAGRQDLHADDGRGRHHRRHREAAVGQPGGDRRARPEDPSGADDARCRR